MADKAIWVLTGGIVHGQPTFERRWSLEADDFEERGAEAIEELWESVLRAMREWSDPAAVNWTNLEFVWT